MKTMLANAGVPMLFVQMPLLLITLPAIIAVEAMLCRRWLAVSWQQALKWTSIANAISTMVGFPVLWIALVIVQMVVGGGSTPKLPEPWFSVYTVTVQAAWLLPFENRLYWMIPTACLVLLIPAFFVTVLIEEQVYRRSFGESRGPVGLTPATWRMHLVSYGLLVVAGLCLLGSSIASHKSEPGAATDGGPAAPRQHFRPPAFPHGFRRPDPLRPFDPDSPSPPLRRCIPVAAAPKSRFQLVNESANR
jgi:hypothetical protein